MKVLITAGGIASALVAAYAVGAAVWVWATDPLMRRDATAERALGAPLGLPRYRSAR